MKITEDDLQFVRDKHHDQRIVFVSGGFDLTHAGHVVFLEAAKNRGDILVVGIASDATRRKERGDLRPILHEDARLKMVSSLKPVDYAFLITRLAQAGEHPLAPLEPILRSLRPDIWAMNDDLKVDVAYRSALAKEFGTLINVLLTQNYGDFHGLSTTSIIDKIVASHTAAPGKK